MTEVLGKLEEKEGDCVATGHTGHTRTENLGLNFQLDHVVHLVREVNSTTALMGAEGFHTVMGGRHLTWGTANALCHFGLSYVELLEVENWLLADVKEQNDLVQQAAKDLKVGEGLARIAIRTSDIHKTATWLKEHGLQIEGPLPGQRQRPDGHVIRWSLLFARSPLSSLPLPFFIQWEDSDERRMLDLGKLGVIGEHALGELEIREIAFVTSQPERTARLWKQWFGLYSAGYDIPLPDDQAGEGSSHSKDRLLPAKGCFRLSLGEIMLNFCPPEHSALAQEVFTQRGERPFAILFKGARQPKKVIVRGTGYDVE